MRRATLLALALLAVRAPGAAAHGGYPIVDATDNGYAVLVQASRTTQDGRPAVDLTTYLTRQDLGEPDLAADVRLRVTGRDGRTRELRPRAAGGGYEAVLAGAPGAWRHWRVAVAVRGAAGRAAVTADPAADYDGLPGWLWPVLGVVVLAAGAGSATVLRHRLRRTEVTA